MTDSINNHLVSKYNITNNQQVSCKVCGDRASGKHYGVPSCDGCRGFFKRSIRRNLEYQCKEGGTCVVDVSRRNQCQSCRFSKCLKVNMRREAVQHERAPRSCMTQSHVNGFSTDMFSSKQLPIFTSTCNLLSSEFLSTSITNFSYNTLAFPFHFDINLYGNNGLHSDNNTFQKSQQSYNENNFKKPSTIHPHNFNTKTEAVYESSAKLLFLAVKWTRSITEFNRLPIHDQTLLLEESWAELFIITASQWGLNVDILPKNNVIENLQTAINKYQQLRIDQTEANCLKALILFKSDCFKISSSNEIKMLQEQAFNLLYNKCGTIRFGHILMLLPSIKFAANPQKLQEILFKGTVGEVAIERILGNLLCNIN